MGAEERRRKNYLDFLRVIAAFLVLVQHSEFFYLYKMDGVGRGYSFVMSFLSSLVTMNVPIFFLISGALLLGKEETYRVVYGKRIPGFLLLIFLTSLFTYGFRNASDFHVKGFLRGFFDGSTDGTHWFLYAYMGFLVVLPFLRRAVKGMTHTDAVVLLCFRFLFRSVLPCLRYATAWKGYPDLPFSSKFSVPFATQDILFYPIMGYYLEHLIPWDSISRKWAALCPLLMVGGNLVSAAVTCHQGLNTAFSDSYLSMFCYCTAISMFVLTKLLFIRRKPGGIFFPKFDSVLAVLSPLMLGVYLLEPVLRPLIKPVAYGMLGAENPILSPLWYCCFSMAVLSGITWLLKKLPVLRRTL